MTYAIWQESIIIEDNVLIGTNIFLRSSDHSFDILNKSINNKGMYDEKDFAKE